jgi:Flp pilus assembly protein TadD
VVSNGDNRPNDGDLELPADEPAFELASPDSVNGVGFDEVFLPMDLESAGDGGANEICKEIANAYATRPAEENHVLSRTKHNAGRHLIPQVAARLYAEAKAFVVAGMLSAVVYAIYYLATQPSFQLAFLTKPDNTPAQRGIIATRPIEAKTQRRELPMQSTPISPVAIAPLQADTQSGTTEHYAGHEASPVSKLGSTNASTSGNEIARFQRFADVPKERNGKSPTTQEEAARFLSLQREALRERPKDVAILNNIAWTLATSPFASLRNSSEAVTLAREATELSQNREPAVLGTLATAYAAAGQFSEAVATARKALALATQKNEMALAESLQSRLLIYEKQTRQRRATTAVEGFQQTASNVPERSRIGLHSGKFAAAEEQAARQLAKRREELRARPNDAAVLNNTAWILATSPFVSLRNGPEAVTLARRATELFQNREPAFLGTLAAAYAEVGQFTEAAATARKALALATQQNKMSLAESIQSKLPLYERQMPYRESLVQSSHARPASKTPEPSTSRPEPAGKPLSDHENTSVARVDTASATTPVQKYRTWTDVTGKYHTDAGFAGIASGKVALKKGNGSTIHVPLEKLSIQDRQWIRDQEKQQTDKQP